MKSKGTGLSSSAGSFAVPRLRLGQTGEGFESAVSERVRLYLKVTFLINAFLTSAMAVIILVAGSPEAANTEASDFVVAALVTVVNGIAWFLVWRGRKKGFGAPLAGGLTTLVLSAGYTYVTAHNANDVNPTRTLMFCLLAVTVILVLRSSLVPSPATTTAVIGLIAVAFPVYSSRPSPAHDGDWVFFAWQILMSGVVVAVTTVTSHTVYGLQRRMRAAAQLGQYHIQRPLGRGGMGEVYLAQHALLQRPTAIKLLRDASAGSDLFRQEVQTASGLTHPNTVEIYDYGRTPDGVFYFAMEYVEGATLEDVVRATGTMPARRVIHLLHQAAGALGEAHERGLVHRDVKPQNLMLCERGGLFDTLKVMDFGLVRDLAGQKTQTEGGLTGTPLYLAPEAILEADGAVPQSDVYALGATAYFLLAGTPPFAGGNLVETLSDHLVVEPPPFPCDDPSLAELVRRCLAKDVGDRPADARVLAGELESCRDHGEWKTRDASIWWAEHQELVAARRPGDDAVDSGASRPVSSSARAES